MPISRKEFEKNTHIVAEQLHQGNVFFSEKTFKLMKCMKYVHVTPNRRVNLHTINEGARVTINSIASMNDRISLFQKNNEVME